MKQFICVHVGQAGIQIGIQFWKLLMKEYGINQDGILLEENDKNSYIEAMFGEDKDGRYRPRALFGDLDPSTIDELGINSDLANVILAYQVIAGKESACANYSRGHYTIGKDIIQKILDKVEDLANDCESLDSIVCFNSIAGGTGGGVTSLLLERLTIDYPKVNRICFNIMPSIEAAESVIESLNFSLSLKNFIENCDLNVMYDNNAITKIIEKFLKIQDPSIEDINKVIALSASSVLSGSRFGVEENYSIDKILGNLTPYPRLHFVVPSYAPFIPKIEENSQNISLDEGVKFVINQENSLLYGDPEVAKDSN